MLISARKIKHMQQDTFEVPLISVSVCSSANLVQKQTRRHADIYSVQVGNEMKLNYYFPHWHYLCMQCWHCLSLPLSVGFPVQLGWCQSCLPFEHCSLLLPLLGMNDLLFLSLKRCLFSPGTGSRVDALTNFMP